MSEPVSRSPLHEVVPWPLTLLFLCLALLTLHERWRWGRCGARLRQLTATRLQGAVGSLNAELRGHRWVIQRCPWLGSSASQQVSAITEDGRGVEFSLYDDLPSPPLPFKIDLRYHQTDDMDQVGAWLPLSLPSLRALSRPREAAYGDRGESHAHD